MLALTHTYLAIDELGLAGPGGLLNTIASKHWKLCSPTRCGPGNLAAVHGAGG